MFSERACRACFTIAPCVPSVSFLDWPAGHPRVWLICISKLLQGPEPAFRSTHLYSVRKNKSEPYWPHVSRASPNFGFHEEDCKRGLRLLMPMPCMVQSPGCNFFVGLLELRLPSTQFRHGPVGSGLINFLDGVRSGGQDLNHTHDAHHVNLRQNDR